MLVLGIFMIIMWFGFMLYSYVAPEYANTGLLNEKSDVYSFGVVLVETITGRDPVDYGRPHKQVDLLIILIICKFLIHA